MSNQSGQSLKSALNDHINPVSVVKGIAISYVITIFMFMLFALILTYTDFPEKYISPVVAITTIISILIAGSTATRNIKNKGWLNGGVVGIIYILILYLSSSLVFRDFSVDNHVVTMALAGILTGSIGGIIGINIRRPGKGKMKR